MITIAIFTQNITAGAFQSVAANLTHAFYANKLAKIDVLYVKGDRNSIDKSIFAPCTNFIKISSGRSLKSIMPLVIYLNRKKPTFLISMPAYINIVAIFAKRISNWKGKLIITEHATMSEKLNEHKGELIMGNIHILAKLFYRYADALVAVSKGVLDDLKSNILISLPVMKFIPNPLNPPLLKKKAALPIKSHPWLENLDMPCFISIGRLAKQKNFGLLLKAFGDVVKKNTQAKLIIIGEGNQRNKLTAKIKSLNLTDSVELLGFIKNPYPYLKKADVFVLSSKEEGFGLVLVESMILGTPIISTNAIGGGPDSILQGGKHGFLINDFSSQKLTKAMLSFIDDENKKKNYREKGVIRSLRYIPSEIGKEWIELFKEII